MKQPKIQMIEARRLKTGVFLITERYAHLGIAIDQTCVGVTAESAAAKCRLRILETIAEAGIDDEFVANSRFIMKPEIEAIAGIPMPEIVRNVRT